MEKDGFWVFGYGSLIWQPGFTHDARLIARLDGFARSFCMRSIHHRGTSAAPGLVLALDVEAGAEARGGALRVPPEHGAATLGYLRERELVSSAYLEQMHEITLSDQRRVKALCYVVDPAHVQYCGHLTLEQQATIIARASGGRGPNDEYLYNTARHLRDLGIEDRQLDWLETRVRALKGDAGRGHSQM